MKQPACFVSTCIRWIGRGGIIFITIIGSSTGWAQAEPLSTRDLSEIQRLGAARGHSKAEVETLINRARQAEGRGLPHEPLVNKIKEGLAKGIPPSRISPVLQGLEGHLREAREVLAEQGRGGERDARKQRRATEVLAEALGRGVTRDDIRTLRRSGKGGKGRVDSDALAFGAKGLALTKEAGIAKQDGVPLVGEAIRQGFRPNELLDLGREIKKRGKELKGDRARLRDIQKAVGRGERADRIFRDNRGRGSGRGGGGDRNKDEGRDRERRDGDRRGGGDRDRDDRSGGRDDRGDRLDRSDRVERGDRGSGGGGDDRSGRDGRRGRGGRDH